MQSRRSVHFGGTPFATFLTLRYPRRTATTADPELVKALIDAAAAAFQALVIVLALLWELAFSGPMLNPARPGDFDEHGQDSKVAEQAAYDRAAASPMPPRARILIYSGYLLLTASAVLQIGTLRSPVTGAPLQAFDAETIVRIGVAELGVPLAITLFLLSWLGKAQPAGGDAGTAPAGKVPLNQQRDRLPRPFDDGTCRTRSV